MVVLLKIARSVCVVRCHVLEFVFDIPLSKANEIDLEENYSYGKLPDKEEMT